jgi:23S rRNA pseudouridine1911/1915/1917 synthase
MLPVDFEDDDYSLADPVLPVQLPFGGAEQVEIKVSVSFAGCRLDQAIAEMLPGHSRSRLAGFIKDGSIKLDGRVVQAKTKLLGGELISGQIAQRDADAAYSPEELELNILHADESIIVIDKPPGLVVHPAAGNWSGTLLNGLLFAYPELARIPRAGIVHRLDKDTSGVMVVARTEAAQISLVRQLQARTMKRIYLAITRGHLRKDGSVDQAIGRHPHHRTKMAVMREGHAGKPAVTHYRVLQQYAFHTLIECQLETGRTHQIRVHMQSIGFPLEGDPVYGPPMTGIDEGVRDVIREFGRQALHARKLTLMHPEIKTEMTFEAPIPADMKEFIEFVEGLG